MRTVPRPRLLFVVTEDWYFRSHRLALAKAAIAAGFDVAVATRVANHAGAIEELGVRVVPFAIDRGGMNLLRDALTIARLAILYRRERPDIVHHVAMKPVLYGSLAARMAGVRRIVNALAGMGWLFTAERSAQGRLPAVVGRLMRSALRSTCVIVQNPDDAAAVAEQWSPADLRVIRGAGVDCHAFTPVPTPPEPPLVVLPARMLADKGVNEFVDAARMVKASGHLARFALVGAPDPANPASIPVTQLAAWRDEGSVEWWGHREDMPAVYAQAHLVCLPSYREGLPKSLLEAAACGLPIVAADVTGCREVVRDGYNGLLVPPRDAAALSAALLRLIAEPNTRKLMGARGRQRARQEFAQERIVAETIAVYRELLA
ncbi:MAG: glycosyltransferase family 1 protein [Lautropia sp.]|nr:MAG: glycosyltransferase family 1 protein [Pseudomonadota bacterium]MBC6960379.1 glycosyltransferase family 1 protein [Lautropia sp.]MCL4702146.1 glycosyltransferase family 4 protein [Burkholderiaceae bacterium]MDL1908125.1 glycosyltransferase family 4 protein [Betaproteobacteria bacterium PRO1]RIK87260.1 MAG: glycosyltransferase family 1 protein [Burkholderiales bacterium]